MKRIVTIGGGTGNFVLLSGLKNYPVELTAITSMFDNGGSTGVLRDELGVLPPGDIRRCLVALSEHAPILRELFVYRFEQGFLKGHNAGNIFLSALEKITGNFEEGVKEASRILNTRGTILPISLEQSNLCVELEDGSIIHGETNIDVPKHDGSLKIVRVFLDTPVKMNPKIPRALKDADIVVIGPGDLYTSIIPNFLVEGFQEALQISRAKKIYICNLVTKWGETNGFTVSDFVSTITQYLPGISFDTILVNNKKPNKKVLERYHHHRSEPVEIDAEAFMLGNLIKDNFVSENELFRHDPNKLAKSIMELVEKERVAQTYVSNQDSYLSGR